MVNDKLASNMFRIELDFASRAPILGNEEGHFCKLLQLLKVVKIDLFSTTALGRSVLTQDLLHGLLKVRIR